jgi:hypothetical protein
MEQIQNENTPLSDPKMSPHSDPQMTDPQMIAAVADVIGILNKFKRHDRMKILNSSAALLG